MPQQYFTAPVTHEIGLGLPFPRTTEERADNALFNHFGPITVGENVYITTDNVVHTEWPGNTAVRVTFFGGHGPEAVSDADATLLSAAGLGAGLS